MAKGGWYKAYDDELEDPKVGDLTDSEYRVWQACLKFCNRSPARLRERGYLYHSKGFPVSAQYIARRLAKPAEEVAAALDRLCQVGGATASLLALEDGEGGPVYRVRAWRKRQRGDDEGEENPEKLPKSSQEAPTLSPPDVDVRRRRKTETKTEDKDNRYGDAPASPRSPRGSRPSNNAALQWYVEQRDAAGRPAVVVPHAQVGRLLKQAEQQLGAEECHARFLHYLSSRDPWDEKHCWSLENFFSATTLNRMGAPTGGRGRDGIDGPRRFPDSLAFSEAEEDQDMSDFTGPTDPRELIPEEFREQ
jgi:hypothetical protein